MRESEDGLIGQGDAEERSPEYFDDSQRLQAYKYICCCAFATCNDALS